MKRIIIIILTCIYAVSNAQNNSAFNLLKSCPGFELPYKELKNNNAKPLIELPYNKYDELILDIKSKVWVDVQMKTPYFDYEDKSILDSPGHSWGFCGKISSSNDNYITALVSTQVVNNVAKTFVCIDKNDSIIDRLEAYSLGETQFGVITLRQFKIEKDTTITVYEIRSIIEGAQNMWSERNDSFYGARRDSRYCITPEGRFKLLRKTTYESQKYYLTDLADTTKQIWNGKEKISGILNPKNNISAFDLLKSCPSIELPYKELKSRNENPLIEFPYNKFNGEIPGIKSKVWMDLQLKTPFPDYGDKTILDHPGHLWNFRSKMPSSNDKYITVCVSTMAGPNTTRALLCLNKNDSIIDRLDVYSYNETPFGEIALRQFKVTADTTITVYEVRSVEGGSRNMWSEGYSSFYGLRTDMRYCITPEGRFKLLQKTTYEPQKYYLTDLADNTTQIWDGKEKIKTSKICK